MPWKRRSESWAIRGSRGQALEGELADEQVGGLLVAADLPKGDGPGAVTVGLLDAAGGGGGLARGLGGQLLAGSLAPGGLAGGLLGPGHVGLLRGRCRGVAAGSAFFLIVVGAGGSGGGVHLLFDCRKGRGAGSGASAFFFDCC